MFSNNWRARSPCTGSEYKTPTVGFRIGLACRIGPRSFTIVITASSWDCDTAKGVLFTVAMRWPERANVKLGTVAITTLEMQLICFSSSSSTSTQQSSVANKLARPPAASRISRQPQPISWAALLTASSSPTSPSSSSVTQTCPSPSVSSNLTSSSFRTCPLPNNFRPLGRKIVQQRILPADSRISTVCAFMVPPEAFAYIEPVPSQVYSNCELPNLGRISGCTAWDSLDDSAEMIKTIS